MADPKPIAKTDSATNKALQVPEASNGPKESPYKLDPAQVYKASIALLVHMRNHAQSKQEKAEKKDLLADDEHIGADEVPVFLNVATKTHIHDSHRLKPAKIKIPHSIYNDSVRVCIFSKDPQRAYKDVVADPQFPEDVRSKIGRVIGLDKLKKKYKSYESKRQLLAEYDVFMVDKRIIKSVADFLGKTFYGTKSRRPLPVDLTAGSRLNEKTGQPVDDVGKPLQLGYEIKTALNSTYVSMSPSLNTSIKVGRLSMTYTQLQENIIAVCNEVISRFVPRGWRNIRRLEIKGPTTKALPIWVFDEMWVDDSQILEEEPKFAIGHTEGEKALRKRKWDEWAKDVMNEEDFDRYMNIEMTRRDAPKKKRRSRENKDKGSISKEKRDKLKQAALEDVPKSVVPQ